MTPIRYSQWRRWADSFHGWRDGRAGIPARLPAVVAAGPATTGHREALIRQAQDTFGYEHLEYRRRVAEPHRRIMAERARLAAARAALDWATAAFTVESAALAGPETRRRRLGEEHHPETVIVQRRHRDHQKLLARARADVIRSQAEVTSIEADLDKAVEEARQLHQAAILRVVRIHEHIHRRLACYRRALIRAHPDGAWVNSVLSVRAPEIPGWALPDAYLPEGVPAPEVPDEADDPDQDGEQQPDESPAEIRQLLHDVTRFGAEDYGASGQGQPAGFGYVVLKTPVAAAWHFTVLKAHGRLQLKTRGYPHGPYIAGEAVGTAVLEPGDFFDFAGRRYTMLDADRLQDAPLGACDLIAADLCATSGSKVRLQRMSFVQWEKTLLAVLGPSGAGKSSLCYALLAELPLKSGQLYFRNMSMATHSRQIREQLGFVPQDIALHTSLTVEDTLRYACGLRSPQKKRYADFINSALEKVNLKEEERHQLLSTLSGGQLRRVSIALEMLVDPPLLMLDEPTSGLDASMDRMVMGVLRKHARQGHTVIVVTHSTEHLPLADQILVVVKNGAPAYSGPPRQIRRHFRFQSYADLMELLLTEPEECTRKYLGERMAREARHEASALEKRLAADPKLAAGPRESTPSRVRRGFGRKLRVLIRRQYALLINRAVTKNPHDRSAMEVVRNWAVVLLPLIVAAGAAALAALVATAPGLGAPPSRAGPTALALLTTLCVLSGQALTYSDVVNEFDVIRREYRGGVGAVLVLTAKWLVYAVLAIAQAGLITVVFCAVPNRGPQESVLISPETDLFFGLAALSVAAMTLGLLVSTLARKLEHAVAIITATSIAQIALNGVTASLATPSASSYIAALLPDRWGLAAAAASVGLGAKPGQSAAVATDALWTHSSGQWTRDAIALALLSAIYFALAAWRLNARLRPPTPGRRRALADRGKSRTRRGRSQRRHLGVAAAMPTDGPAGG
jgi:ABC-type multidrug transport system ATPase subunit